MIGPRNDPDGAKWNALPRRGTGKEMEELRVALADWRGSFPDEWLTNPGGGERRLRVRRAIDAVLAAAPRVETSPSGEADLRATVAQLTKERDELRAEVARYIRDRVCDCDEMCQGMRLTKERDDLRLQLEGVRSFALTERSNALERGRRESADELAKLAKERDEALNKAAVLGQDAEGAHFLREASERRARDMADLSARVNAENGQLRQQIAALKALVREFAREGGNGK